VRSGRPPRRPRRRRCRRNGCRRARRRGPSERRSAASCSRAAAPARGGRLSRRSGARVPRSRGLLSSCRSVSEGGAGRTAPSVHLGSRGRRSGSALTRTTEAERCFLCHSPTLRPWIAADAASYVEERWSPALLRSPEIRRQKQRLIQQRIRMRRWRRGTFLSQAGPRVSVVAFHVEHHPSVLFDLARTTTRATLSGRPRFGADASETLACIPPSEGFPIVRPALGATSPEAGRISDGGDRFGEEHLDVGGQCHRVSVLYRVVP
jgi:hypothetical protein